MLDAAPVERGPDLGLFQLDPLLDQFPGHVWATDAKLRIVSARGLSLAGLGLDPAKLLGRLVTRVYRGRIQPAEAAAMYRRVLEGETVRFRDQAASISFEGVIVPLFGEGGAVVGCLGLALDVSEREDARAQARESGALLQEILANAPVLVFLRDLEGRISYVNPHWQQTTGRSAEEVVGRTIAEVAGEETAEEFERHDREVLESGEARSFLEHAAGRSYWSVKFPVRNEAGEIVRICGIATDVTDRAAAEAEVRWHRHLLAQAQTLARLGTWEWDTRSEEAYWSPPFCELIGVAADDPEIGTAKLYFSLVVDDDRDELLARAVACVGGSEAFTSEHRIRRRSDGALRWMRMTGMLERDETGRTGRLYGFVQDVTDELRSLRDARRLNTILEERVRERTDELEQALSEMRSFNYAVSHDLRQPLRTIFGFLSMLEEEADIADSSVARDAMERIKTATKRMDSLIADLLALAKVANAPVVRQSVNLSAIARDVAADLDGREPDRRVEWRIDDDLVADADPGLARVVLENLLGNAFKFTRSTEGACIVVTSEAAGGARRFVVRDNGAGFDSTQAARLFQPFSRLHNAKEFEGTGIGLATVARIVGRHGGTVAAEAHRGNGATFRFTLEPPAEARLAAAG